MRNPTTVSQRCTIQLHSGQFCDAPAEERISHPMCGRHALQVFRDVLMSYEIEGADPVRRALSMVDWLDDQRAVDPDPGESVVYYLLVGDLVKIGTTNHLARRLQSYPPTSVLLATEPGSVDVEVERHRQFREYLSARREWFTPGPRLREFVESLPDYRVAA